MATRQSNDAEKTDESTVQTDLFSVAETDTDTTDATSESEVTEQSQNSSASRTEPTTDSWDTPFCAHSNTDMDSLVEPRAIFEAREIAKRHGSESTVTKLTSALTAVTTRKCAENIRDLIGIHGTLQGTHMFDENLAETAKKSLNRLQMSL